MMGQHCHLEAKVRFQLLLALEVTGKFRALASWFRFFNPNLGRYAKRKRKGKEKKSLPFIGAPV